MHKGATIHILAPKNAAAMAIEPFIPDFEKLTGIKVQYESFPDDHFRQKILLELAAGTGGMDAFYTASSQEGLKYGSAITSTSWPKGICLLGGYRRSRR